MLHSAIVMGWKESSNLVFYTVYYAILNTLAKSNILSSHRNSGHCNDHKKQRIDNKGGSVNSRALFELVGMMWYQRKYNVLYNIRQLIMNPIY